MTAPSIDQAPPGYYMVFLVDNQGVPSVAPVVRLDKTAGEAPAGARDAELPGQRRQPRLERMGRRHHSGQRQLQPDLDSGAALLAGRSRPEPQIGQLEVRLRSDCCTERDLWVFTSDSPFNSTSVQGLRDQAGVTEHRMLTPSGTVGTSPVGTTARYIRIQDPGTNTQLTLSEVQIDANQDPTVSLTSPANGASLQAPASISYSADAADADGTVAKVEFFRGSTLVGTDTNAPYTASESGVGAGNYTLKARATDNSGAAVDSSTRSITVTAPNNQGPAVSVTAPSAGATFTAPASYTFSADASDADGTVRRSSSSAARRLVGTDTSSPYSVSESGLGEGSYTLTAKATDNNDAATTSSPVNITVNPVPPTSAPSRPTRSTKAGSDANRQDQQRPQRSDQGSLLGRWRPQRPRPLLRRQR